MSLLIPPAKNYTDPLVMQVSRVGLEPTEGRRQVNCEIQWGNYTGNSVNMNLQQNATLALTQIIALSVDNSQCGADVQFIFPDSSDVLTIPAGNPKTIVEVFTSSKQFYVTTGLNSQIVLAADTTRFIILNYLPPPIAVPTSDEQNLASIASIPMIGSGTTQIVPLVKSGTLETVTVFASGPIGSGGTMAFALSDNIGTALGSGQISCGSGDVLNVMALSFQDCRLRFSGGIILTQTGTNFGGKLSVNALYRTP